MEESSTDVHHGHARHRRWIISVTHGGSQLGITSENSSICEPHSDLDKLGDLAAHQHCSFVSRAAKWLVVEGPHREQTQNSCAAGWKLLRRYLRPGRGPIPEPHPSQVAGTWRYNLQRLFAFLHESRALVRFSLANPFMHF
jgi:hypothetical protein